VLPSLPPTTTTTTTTTTINYETKGICGQQGRSTNTNCYNSPTQTQQYYRMLETKRKHLKMRNKVYKEHQNREDKRKT
jgi:subtilase family serine protease